MISPDNILAIYDFELFPYALGDVLTWNIKTAMLCEELGRKKVDICICLDERNPSSIFQQDLIRPQNFHLFFSELYSAFSTHPRLGNIHIFCQQETLIAQLRKIDTKDKINEEIVNDYLEVLGHNRFERKARVARAVFLDLKKNNFLHFVYTHSVPRPVRDAIANAIFRKYELTSYFVKHIQSHESINKYAVKKGGIPFLRPALGCGPDVDEVIGKRLKGKKIVSFHLRLRQLDAGYGAEYSYDRDSDFLEWYDFLSEAGRRYPEVVFIALGRLPEKPLELIRLPNVINLRILGMGLGHELTMMLKSDLFIGTSSGFAAFANFSPIPYFITKMTSMSCHAYAIPDGADRLPFAKQNQKLIYARETFELLMGLLEKGLGLSAVTGHHRQEAQALEPRDVDVQNWVRERSRFINPAATTCRFFTDDKYRNEETAYLLFPYITRAWKALLGNAHGEAKSILKRLEKIFPDLCAKFPQHLLLKAMIAFEDQDFALARACLESIRSMAKDKDLDFFVKSLKSRLTNDPMSEVENSAQLRELKSAIERSGFFNAPV